MNESTNAAEDEGNYYLDDAERWEALGMDCADWNATVDSILRLQAESGQQAD